MKIALVGGGGRLGKSLVKFLREFNSEFSFNIVGRRKYEKLDQEIKENLLSKDSYFNEKDLDHAIEKSDKIFIFIPSSGLNYEIKDEFKYIKDKIIPKTSFICERAFSKAKHIILISSGAVYNANTFQNDLTIGPNELSELKKIDERNGYAYVKLMQEKILRDIYKKEENYTILRLFSISDYFFSKPVFAIEDIISQANNSIEKPLIISNAEIYRSFISTYDISKIIYNILRSSIYGIFNLSGKEVISITDLAKLAIKESGIKRDILFKKDINQLTKITRNNYYGDPTKSFQLYNKDSFQNLDFQIRMLTARVKKLNENK